MAATRKSNLKLQQPDLWPMRWFSCPEHQIALLQLFCQGGIYANLGPGCSINGHLRLSDLQEDSGL